MNIPVDPGPAIKAPRRRLPQGVPPPRAQKALPTVRFGFDEHPMKNQTGAWAHGPRSSNGLLCALQLYAREVVAAFEPDLNVIGFKEIRHWRNEDLDFFRELFPCGRFIVSTRQNLERQMHSTFWAGSGAEGEQELREKTESLESWQRAHPGAAYLLQVESFDLSKFNDLLSWLRITGCTYTQVAHANDSGGQSGLQLEEGGSSRYASSSKAEFSGQCVFDSHGFGRQP